MLEATALPTEPQPLPHKLLFHVNSGCGTVGAAASSNARDPQFESSHWHNLYVLPTVLKRQKQRKKRPGMAQLKNACVLCLNPH